MHILIIRNNQGRIYGPVITDTSILTFCFKLRHMNTLPWIRRLLVAMDSTERRLIIVESIIACYRGFGRACICYSGFGSSYFYRINVFFRELIQGSITVAVSFIRNNAR